MCHFRSTNTAHWILVVAELSQAGIPDILPVLQVDYNAQPHNLVMKTVAFGESVAGEFLTDKLYTSFGHQ